MNEHLATTRAMADATVADAEQESREAAALVAALEERVRDGDDTVTPKEIATARELGHFAKLRADATARKAADAKRTARLAALTELRADIDAYTETTDTDQLIDNIFDALLAYTQHFTAHNERVNQWRTRMAELGVPKIMGPDLVSADDAHLGINGRELYAGRTVYNPVDHKGRLAYHLTELGTAMNIVAAHIGGPREEQALASARERTDRVKASARSGVRTMNGPIV
ncbi:hypothetical protein [Streptomyces zaomyceticus]|uniref:hypothetical protein n=1 Tax=Streptomyces zaomyceticus TaxID=68286 RepID=UPI002E203142